MRSQKVVEGKRDPRIFLPSSPIQFWSITSSVACNFWDLWVIGYKQDLGLLKGVPASSPGSQLSFLKTGWVSHSSIRNCWLGPKVVGSREELDPHVINWWSLGESDIGQTHNLSEPQVSRGSMKDELNEFSLETDAIISDLKLARIPVAGLARKWLPSCLYIASPLGEHTTLFSLIYRITTTQKTHSTAWDLMTNKKEEEKFDRIVYTMGKLSCWKRQHNRNKNILRILRWNILTHAYTHFPELILRDSSVLHENIWILKC